jgi:hypothetical protein
MKICKNYETGVTVPSIRSHAMLRGHGHRLFRLQERGTKEIDDGIILRQPGQLASFTCTSWPNYKSKPLRLPSPAPVPLVNVVGHMLPTL